MTAYVWTHTSRLVYAADEAEARTLILSEAYRDVPRTAAYAAVLSMRRTASGRYRAMVKRSRRCQWLARCEGIATTTRMHRSEWSDHETGPWLVCADHEADR